MSWAVFEIRPEVTHLWYLKNEMFAGSLLHGPDATSY